MVVAVGGWPAGRRFGVCVRLGRRSVQLASAASIRRLPVRNQQLAALLGHAAGHGRLDVLRARERRHEHAQLIRGPRAPSTLVVD